MHFRFAEFLFIGDIFGQLYGSGITVKAAAAAPQEAHGLGQEMLTKCVGPELGYRLCSNHTKSWRGLRHKQDLGLWLWSCPGSWAESQAREGTDIMGSP